MPNYLEKNISGLYFFIIAKKSIMTADFVAFVESMSYTVIERDLDESLVYPFVINNCDKSEFELLLDMYKGI